MAKKNQTGSAASADRHKNTAVGLRLAPDLRATVEKMAVKERRSLAQMCAILLEEGLASRGHRAGSGDAGK